MTTQLDIRIGERVNGHRCNYYRWTERDATGAVIQASPWTTAPPKHAPWRA